MHWNIKIYTLRSTKLFSQTVWLTFLKYHSLTWLQERRYRKLFNKFLQLLNLIYTIYQDKLLLKEIEIIWRTGFNYYKHWAIIVLFSKIIMEADQLQIEIDKYKKNSKKMTIILFKEYVDNSRNTFTLIRNLTLIKVKDKILNKVNRVVIKTINKKFTLMPHLLKNKSINKKKIQCKMNKVNWIDHLERVIHLEILMFSNQLKAKKNRITKQKLVKRK